MRSMRPTTGAKRKRSGDRRAPSLAQLARPAWVAEQIANRRGERGIVAGFDEQTAAAMKHLGQGPDASTPRAVSRQPSPRARRAAGPRCASSAPTRRTPRRAAPHLGARRPRPPGRRSAASVPACAAARARSRHRRSQSWTAGRGESRERAQEHVEGLLPPQRGHDPDHGPFPGSPSSALAAARESRSRGDTPFGTTSIVPGRPPPRAATRPRRRRRRRSAFAVVPSSHRSSAPSKREERSTRLCSCATSGTCAARASSAPQTLLPKRCEWMRSLFRARPSATASGPGEERRFLRGRDRARRRWRAAPRAARHAWSRPRAARMPPGRARRRARPRRARLRPRPACRSGPSPAPAAANSGRRSPRDLPDRVDHTVDLDIGEGRRERQAERPARDSLGDRKVAELVAIAVAIEGM